MFSLFRRPKTKAPEAELFLALPDAAFTKAVKALLEPGPEMAWTMCAVAYQNLKPRMQVFAELSKARPAEGLPADTDSVIRFLNESLNAAPHEIAERRMAWFFQASLILRATERGAANPTLHNDVAAIWIMVARGCAALKDLHQHNALWSTDELRWFSHIRNEKDGISYCLTILAPKYLREGEYFEAFAQEHDILLLPWW